MSNQQKLNKETLSYHNWYNRVQSEFLSRFKDPSYGHYELCERLNRLTAFCEYREGTDVKAFVDRLVPLDPN